MASATSNVEKEMMRTWTKDTWSPSLHEFGDGTSLLGLAAALASLCLRRGSLGPRLLEAYETVQEVTFALKYFTNFQPLPLHTHLNRTTSLIYLHIVRFMCVGTKGSS